MRLDQLDLNPVDELMQAAERYLVNDFAAVAKAKLE